MIAISNNGAEKMKYQPITPINKKRIPYQFSNGALVCTPKHFAMSQRVARLAKLLKQGS